MQSLQLQQDLVQLRRYCLGQRPNDDLILCTLVGKEGSSYRQLGAMKVIPRGGKPGESCGVLSGGCLEASIENTARERFAELPFLESFSTLAEEDRLLGYQTGCHGRIQILFEKIHIQDLDLYFPWGKSPRAAGVEINLRLEVLGRRNFVERPSRRAGSFFIPWVRPIHLQIIGCGPDTAAFLPLAKLMEWQLTFFDHRTQPKWLSLNEDVAFKTAPIDRIGELISEGECAAVLLMTHNFEHDLEIMRGLRLKHLGYVGCLGPEARFQRLKSDLRALYGEEISDAFESRVLAPAGIFKHGHSAEEIALSIVAQIQQVLVETSSSKTAVLVLAAGASLRFQGIKALASWRGQSLLERALATARAIAEENVTVVVGAHAAELQPHLRAVHVAENPNWSAGMGASLAFGVAAILRREPQTELIAVVPVDQPMIRVTHLRRLMRESQLAERCGLTVDVTGVIGAPAVLPKKFFALALQLDSERGMKSVLKPDEMILVHDAYAMRDVDQQEDLARLEVGPLDADVGSTTFNLR